ncbi:MAG TPA: GAF domain-containing protein [Nitriliruptorales bacterium]
MDVAAFARLGGPPLAAPTDADLLDEVALTVNSSLELREVLRKLAELALRICPADRASVFLIKDRHLEPAVSIATRPDPEMWSAFTSMEPIDLETIPDVWALMLAGVPVAIDDALASDHVPTAWAERFDVESVVLAPLVAGGQPSGLMAVELASGDTPDDGDVERLGTLGAYAGMVVRNARTLESSTRRARLREALAKGSAALTQQMSAREIAETLADAYADLLDARVCGIGLFDTEQTRLTPLATRGTRAPNGPIPVAFIPAHVAERARSEWATSFGPLRFDDPWFDRVVGVEAGRLEYVVLPLAVEGAPRGAVLLGFAGGNSLDAEQLAAAEALASMASSALERTTLLDRLQRQVRRFEILYDLSSTIVEGADAHSVVARLNELLSGYGVEVRSIAFRDRRLTDFLGAGAPTPDERRAWRGQRGAVELPDATLSIPMRLGRRHAGSIRVRPVTLDGDDRSFLEALARGVIEVANRGALRSELDEADRERALAAERSRIAADLHDSVGQLFVAVGLMARRSMEQLPPASPWGERLDQVAELADRGKQEVTHAIRALRDTRAGSGPGVSETGQELR